MNGTMRLNRRHFVSATLSAAAAMACKPDVPMSSEAKTRFAADFLPDWAMSRQVTLEFAAAMPEEFYDFRPAPELRSFSEHMLHIAESSMVNVARFVKGEKPPGNDFSAMKTKAEIITYLEQAYEYVAQAARELSDERADESVPFPEGVRFRRKIFWYVRDHATHHRGQTVPYFRLKGVVPPRYRA